MGPTTIYHDFIFTCLHSQRLFLNEVTFIATMVRVYTTPGRSELNPFRLVCLIPISVSMQHSFLYLPVGFSKCGALEKAGRAEKRIVKSLFI